MGWMTKEKKMEIVRAYNRAYYKKTAEHQKAYQRAYNRRPEVRARKEEYRKQMKALRQAMKLV